MDDQCYVNTTSCKRILMLLIGLIISIGLVSGCGNDSDDDPAPSSNWDEIIWDQGNWG